MFALSYSEALKCLQCTSATLLEDKDCINGLSFIFHQICLFSNQTHLGATKSTECPAAMRADGCLVNKSSALNVDTWARTCCVGALCIDTYSDVGGVQIWNERYCHYWNSREYKIYNF